MKKLLLATVWLCCLLSATVQKSMATSGIITGKVNDENNNPIAYATVILSSAKDSSLVKGDFTDESGNFYFEDVQGGSYLVTITSLNTTKFVSNTIEIKSTSLVDLGTIVLKKITNELAGITVTAQKPIIQHEGDKLVLNVEGSSISAGGTAMEVIEKAPGVVVDQEGHISLRGKQGVLVMIDDKPTYLSADQLTNQLKSMPSDAIAKVEVITNPSSRYDAEGNAGIINIVTKKDKNLGWNGAVNAGVERSHDWNPGAGINLNYHEKKFNLFGSYNYSNHAQLQTLDVVRNFQYENLESTVREGSILKNDYQDQSYKAGIDFFLNDQQTIGIVANGYFDRYTTDNNTSANIYNSDGSYEPSSHTKGDLNTPSNNLSFNLNYDGKLDTSGTKLSADLDYSYFKSNGNDYYTTLFYKEDGSETDSPFLYNTKSPGTIVIKSAKLDFIHPVDKWNIEAGVKTSAVKNDNEEIFSVSQNNEWVIDSSKTNHFIYDENIYAGYLQISREFKNLSVQAGLRGEITHSNGNSVTLQESFKRNYFQLFPSVNVSDKLNDNNQLSLSYSRRIDRPNYDQLNPFLFFLDPYVYEQGNPNLKPQLTHSLELSWTLKEIYSLSFGYSRTTDEIEEQFYQTDSTKTIVLLSDNFGSNTTYAATAFAQLQPVKWWSITPVVVAFYQDLRTNYLETDFRNTNYGYNLNLRNNFTLPKGFSVELSALYQSPVLFSIAAIKGYGDVSLGFKKSLWDGKATLKLNFKDIFNTNNIVGQIQYANINSSFEQNNDRRRVGLTFTYRLGNSQASQRVHQSSIDEEKGRVKRGG